MTTLTKVTLLVLTLGLAVSGCDPASTSSTPDLASPGTPFQTEEAAGEFTDPGLNLLVAQQGEVLLKRAAWSDYHPTGFGTVLERGDLLKLSGGAQAKVLCDNLTLWPVPDGAPAGLNSGCPQPPEPALMRGGAKVGATRGADPLVPYIISPRATSLLDNTPTLRWNDTGSATYRVEVRGGDLSWQQEGVAQTELVYPGEPALEPRVFYLLVVEDGQGRSSQDEGLKGLGFSLLEEAEAGRVRADAERISGLGLSSEAEAFALARLYTGHGLIAEAVEILEGLVEEGSQQAAVHQALAEQYKEIGLSLMAESRYLEAAKLAEAGGSVEGLAAVQASLGEVYARLNNTEEAVRWLSQAQANYERLGDTGRASEIAERLDQLNR